MYIIYADPLEQFQKNLAEGAKQRGEKKERTRKQQMVQQYLQGLDPKYQKLLGAFDDPKDAATNYINIKNQEADNARADAQLGESQSEHARQRKKDDYSAAIEAADKAYNADSISSEEHRQIITDAYQAYSGMGLLPEENMSIDPISRNTKENKAFRKFQREEDYKDQIAIKKEVRSLTNTKDLKNYQFGIDKNKINIQKQNARVSW